MELQDENTPPTTRAKVDARDWMRDQLANAQVHLEGAWEDVWTASADQRRNVRGRVEVWTELVAHWRRAIKDSR